MKKTIAVFALLLAASPARADIVWAAAGPYTGQVASIGQAQQAGIRQAVDDINAAGGVSGQKIALKTYDDACDPKQAVAAANKIISDNIHFVLHGSCSASSLAAQKIYGDENVLVVNSVSSNIKITDDGGPRLFRAMYRDDGAAIILSQYILKHDRALKLAILHDRTTYGQGIAEAVRDKLNQGGLKEVLFESYDPNSRDYATLVARLKQADIQTLFVAGLPVPMGLMARQLNEAGVHVQFIGSDLDDQDFWKVAGATGEGALFASPADPRKALGAKEVIAKLQKAGVTIDGYTLYAYAAAQVLAQAIAKTGNTDPGKIANIIHASSFDTILGKWSFDAKGDVPNIRLVMYRWHDGQFDELKE